jgi:hypothetical protein
MKGVLMANIHLYLFAILGGACYLPLSGGSPARGDKLGQQTVALGQAEGNRLRQVQLEAEFRSLLRADRAVLKVVATNEASWGMLGSGWVSQDDTTGFPAQGIRLVPVGTPRW